MNVLSVVLSALCQSYSIFHAGISLPAFEITNTGEYAIEQTFSVVLTALNYYFATRKREEAPMSMVMHCVCMSLHSKV